MCNTHAPAAHRDRACSRRGLNNGAGATRRHDEDHAAVSRPARVAAGRRVSFGAVARFPGSIPRCFTFSGLCAQLRTSPAWREAVANVSLTTCKHAPFPATVCMPRRPGTAPPTTRALGSVDFYFDEEKTDFSLDGFTVEISATEPVRAAAVQYTVGVRAPPHLCRVG